MEQKNSSLFINSEINLQKKDAELLKFVNLSKEKLRDRWSSEQGKQILEQWEKSGFDRKKLETLVGKYYDHIDIRGIPLAQKDLTGVDLTKVDLFSANLQDANLGGADLTDSWLSESNIKGTIFNYAKMDGALLDNVVYDTATNFIGVNLNAINFNLVALLQDLAKNQQRIAHLKTKNPILAFILKITSDYGRSITRWFIWCNSIVIIFGLIYGFIPNLLVAYHNFGAICSLLLIDY